MENLKGVLSFNFFIVAFEVDNFTSTTILTFEYFECGIEFYSLTKIKIFTFVVVSITNELLMFL